jgi:hypothetical protein
MKNPSSVNYWQVVEAYSPEEKLLGYIAHLLKRQMLKLQKDCFTPLIKKLGQSSYGR